MEPIVLRCPDCQTTWPLSDKVTAPAVSCPECAALVVVPERPKTPDAEPEAVIDNTATYEDLVAERKRRKPKRDKPPAEQWREVPQASTDWVGPAFVLVLGQIVVFVAALLSIKWGTLPVKPMVGIGLSALEIVVTVPLTLLGLFVAAGVLGISFGEMRLAMLKIVAMTVAGNGAYWVGTAFGAPLIGWAVLDPLCTVILFCLLFKMEVQEKIMAILVIAVTKVLVARWGLALLMKFFTDVPTGLPTGAWWPWL